MTITEGTTIETTEGMETHAMVGLEEVEAIATMAIITPNEAAPMTKKTITTTAMTKEATETPTKQRPPHQTTVIAKKKKVTALNPKRSMKQQ